MSLEHRTPRTIASLLALVVSLGTAAAALVPSSVVGSPSPEEESTTHWAYRPLRRPRPPASPSPELEGWARTAIDRFILRKLVENQLAPSPAADRRTILRRVFFDLIGLPPTPEDIEAFLADDSPDGYERLVDRLLASPHHGERWARHWMDVVHYAETHGHDQDRPREHAWPYRDYLIRCFNEDRSYARFVQEQVAGDVLSPDDPWAIVATGFLAAGPWDESSLRDIREDSIDREIGRHLDRDDMVTTTLSTFASTTAHCARCHDHKFDPISQREYYSLQAVFAGVDKANRAYDPDPEVAKRRRELNGQLERLALLERNGDPTLLDPALEADVVAWEKKIRAARSRWKVLDTVEFRSANGATLTRLDDGSLLSGGQRPEKDTYTIVARAGLREITAVRLEVLTHESLPHGGPGRQDNGNLHLSELAVTATAGDGALTTRPVGLRDPRADFDQSGWAIARAIDGDPVTAWGIYPQIGKPHQAVFSLVETLHNRDDTLLTFELEQVHGGGHLIGRLRLSVTASPPPSDLSVLPPEIAGVLDAPPGQRSDRQRVELAAFVARGRLERQLEALPPQRFVYCGTNRFQPDGSFKPARTPRTVRLLRRGNIRTPGPAVEPGTLSCLEELEHTFRLADGNDEGARRGALARWLSDRKNVLVWRSIANRIWHYHFGRGIVETPGDFGLMGVAPTHPELLDWLAVELLRSGGSLKSLHRLIVTSTVYRQASNQDSPFAEIDGDNRYLWRMHRRRLDAESIQDALLAVSGTLDTTMSGPSVKQFIQTPGIHVTPNLDYVNFDANHPANYRRSIYRFVFRTLPDPFLEAFDCPDGSQLTPKRNESITPLQALAMLNDGLVIKLSEHLASRAGRSEKDLERQVRMVYRWVLGRLPTPTEGGEVRAYAEKHGLANACRILLNSNEFLFVD